MQIDKKLLRRLFLLAAGCLVFAWILLDTEQASSAAKSLWNLISPFVAGAVIAFVFNVPMRAIERQLDGIHKEGLRRVLSIVLTIAALALVIMFVVEMLAPQIQVTVAALTERIPTFIEQTSAKLVKLMDDNPDMKAWIMDIANLESLEWTKILKDSMGFLGNQMSTVMGSAVNVIGSVTSGIVNLVVSIAFAIYCLARKEILARQGRRILYSLIPEKTGDEIIRILRLTNSTFSNFISGQCLEACILGGLFAVTMAIFRMPYIPLVSVIIAVTALVPVVGAFVGCVVGAFFILVDNPLQALTFVAMFLILQQLENNLIYPRVVGTSIGLPGMWVLVAVTIGGELMGVFGMLLMIPLASVLYTLAREFTDKRLAQRMLGAQLGRRRERKQLRVRHVRERQIRVAEDTADLVRRVGHLTGGGEQLFALRGEDVRFAAADFINVAAVGLQLRLGGVEQIQGILRDLHDLRGGKGSSAGDGHQRAHGFAAHILIEAVAGVLVALAAGITHEHAQPQLDLVLQPEPGQQVPGAAGQGALKGGDFGGERLHGLVFRHPGLVAGEHVLQVPGHLLRNFTALGNSLIGHKITPP